jgi:hypothetical protein
MAGQEELMAIMKAYLGVMEAMMKAGQTQMDAKSKTGLEEMNSTELEANQGKLEAMAENCNWAPRVKSMHVRAAQWDRAFDVRGTLKDRHSRREDRRSRSAATA